MQAIILAGGKGTRLKPFTTVFPKPLVPLGDVPVLEVIIRQLSRAGFQKLTISTGHLAELIETFFGNGSRWGIKIQYVRENLPLNTAGALKLLDKVDDNFLVMNGDLLTTLDYAQFYLHHVSAASYATIATKKRKSKIDFGVLEFDKSGKMSNYIEKPEYTFSVSMGIYMLKRECLDYIEPNEVLGMPDLLLRLKGAGHDVLCVDSDCYWLDIGRVDDYELAQQEFETNRHLFLDD